VRCDVYHWVSKSNAALTSIQFAIVIGVVAFSKTSYAKSDAFAIKALAFTPSFLMQKSDAMYIKANAGNAVPNSQTQKSNCCSLKVVRYGGR
jgi:hypothetical protein